MSEFSIRDFTSSKDFPVVSAIITTYNRFHLLCEAIKSVKNQTFSKIEIIIVNDASTDPKYYEEHEIFQGVKIVDLKKNSKSIFGFACPGGYQRNIGMQIARGEYFSFLDDDDYWLPDKISTQLESMRSINSKWSCTDAYIGDRPFNENLLTTRYLYDDNDIVVNKKSFEHLKPIYNFYHPPKFFGNKSLRLVNQIVTSTVMMHREIYEKVGGFQTIENSDDYEYWLRISSNLYQCMFICKPLIYYYRNNDKKYSSSLEWAEAFQKMNFRIMAKSYNLQQLFEAIGRNPTYMNENIKMFIQII